MELEKVALINLVHVARVDGVVAVEETEIIHRYGRALGQRRSEVERLLSRRRLEAICPSDFTESSSERRHVVRMLTRVAHADGKLCRRERARLELVSVTLGVSSLEFADICVAVGHEMGTRRMLRRSHVIGLVAVPVLGFLIWWVYHTLSGESARIERIAIETTARERERTAEAVRAVRRAQAEFDAKEPALRASIAELERRVGEREPPELSPDETWMTRDLERMREELMTLRDARKRFQDIERTASPSVLLIFCRWEMTSVAQRRTFSGWGTGFVARDDGLVVTNKHVVKPWLYKARAQKARDEGFVVDESKTQIAAWTVGSTVRDAKNYLLYKNGFASPNGTLELVATTNDVFESGKRKLPNGQFLQGHYHVNDESDLAVLRIDAKRKLRPLVLAAANELPDKLEPVMVLGYPGMITLRETDVVETAPSLGEVRKVETSIFVDAPIVPGNSGGPVLTVDGKVVGVSSLIFGASTVGGCIPMRFVHTLLDGIPRED